MRSPWQTALLNPLNLAMVGLIVAAGLLSAWWLAPFGIVLWAIMVANLALSPATRLNYNIEHRVSLPMRFQTHFNRIQRAQVSIFNSLSQASGRTRTLLQPVQTEIDRLVNEAHGLCLRQTAAENYRQVTQSRSEIEGELQHIDDALKLVTDPQIRERYEESRKTLHERLALQKDQGARLDKLEAQMVNLVSSLETIVAQIITLQTLDASEIDSQLSRLMERIQAERREMKELEKSLQQPLNAV